MQFGTLKLKQCKYGWMLFGGKYIGKCFDLYGQYSEAEVHILRSFLGEGSVAIDIGANIGDLTIPMSRFVGNSGRIFAVESHPETFNVLCANLALNAIQNVRPLNVFLAEAGTGRQLDGAWGRDAYIGRTWEPTYVALDSLALGQCDFIKIDVDGAELSILRSGMMLIEKYRPVLYFENDNRDLSQELLTLVMDELGYSAYWHPAPIFDANNYFGNGENAWAPNNVVSLMVLAVPKERTQSFPELQAITNPGQWWPGLAA
jgi:FkbM family methyltransferase